MLRSRFPKIGRWTKSKQPPAENDDNHDCPDSLRDRREDQLTDLPEFAEQVEQTVDDIRRASSDLQKTISSNLLIGKKNKKAPEAALSACYKDVGDRITGCDRLFPQTLRLSSDIWAELAVCRREFEAELELDVVQVLGQLSDEVCVKVQKQRRAFNKVSGELRTVKEQLQRATSATNSLPQANGVGGWSTTTTQIGVSAPTVIANSEAVGRVTQAQTQLYDKEHEYNICKEQLLRDLYSFAAQDVDRAKLLLHLFRQQEAFLEASLQVLRKRIPQLKDTIEKQKSATTFHRHLTEHLNETGRKLAYVLERCITRLDNPDALTEEGLFRRTGSKQKTELLIDALNIMQADDQLLATCDFATVASALKQYLYSLPEPLVTFNLASEWAAATKSNEAESLEQVATYLKQMPADFRYNLAYLVRFLAKVAQHSTVNKMSSSNLSLLIAPNLYRLPSQLGHGKHASTGDIERPLDILHNSGPGIHLVDLLIEHVDDLFTDDCGMNVSKGHSRTPSAPVMGNPRSLGRSATQVPTPPLPRRPMPEQLTVSQKQAPLTPQHSPNSQPTSLTPPTDSEPIFKRHSATIAPSAYRKKAAAPRPPLPPYSPNLNHPSSPEIATCSLPTTELVEPHTDGPVKRLSVPQTSDNQSISSEHLDREPLYPTIECLDQEKVNKEPPKRPPRPPAVRQKLSTHSGPEGLDKLEPKKTVGNEEVGTGKPQLADLEQSITPSVGYNELSHPGLDEATSHL